MMQLKNTEQILAQKVADGSIRSYALVVGYRGDEWIFTSKDVDIDTYFDAASLGKIFPTATLALMAIDQGKLSLSDTLVQFFPNVPEDKKNILEYRNTDAIKIPRASCKMPFSVL